MRALKANQLLIIHKVKILWRDIMENIEAAEVIVVLLSLTS